MEWIEALNINVIQHYRMPIPDHNYKCGSQPMVELDPKDQHMAEPNPEDQPLNTRTSSDQWVDRFCEGSYSSSHHSKMGGSSSYHPEQPPISFDMFSDNMYSIPPLAMFNQATDPLDMYSTPQCPPRQQRPVNHYTPNDDTTLGSLQF
ncbi:hypothetical protein GOBAR_AA24385 [Gossypium barbadense]|uniref:Uncharacterized protein n=1 Tax=Gossypium barbadense TaxID=3634 RepID=A0A2P5WYV1_GOSBA|nr:hypothetical protein GOBAR_AA24385 [Gossypium barbadense]